MNASTQKVPEEKTTTVGHRGGSDGEHRCWRCALKKAVALGCATAAASFVKEMSRSSTIVGESLRTAHISEKEISKVTDAIHEIVVYLDGFSSRSTEVH